MIQGLGQDPRPRKPLVALIDASFDDAVFFDFGRDYRLLRFGGTGAPLDPCHLCAVGRARNKVKAILHVDGDASES